MKLTILYILYSLHTPPPQLSRIVIFILFTRLSVIVYSAFCLRFIFKDLIIFVLCMWVFFLHASASHACKAHGGQNGSPRSFCCLLPSVWVMEIEPQVACKNSKYCEHLGHLSGLIFCCCYYCHHLCLRHTRQFMIKLCHNLLGHDLRFDSVAWGRWLTILKDSNTCIEAWVWILRTHIRKDCMLQSL